MSSEEKKQKQLRVIRLLSKVDDTRGGEWTMQALLAYCQGRAYEVAEDEAVQMLGANNTKDRSKRRKALKAGLWVMIEELLACIEILDDEDTATSHSTNGKSRARV